MKLARKKDWKVICRAKDLQTLAAHEEEVVDKQRELEAATKELKEFEAEYSQILERRQKLFEKKWQAEKDREKLNPPKSSGICGS